MSLFVIGDTHLSLSTDKPMDIFSGWNNYMSRLEENWRNVVSFKDTVVIPGDVSWGMSLEGCLEDFRFLDNLPGTKILMKGNHDYWWTTKAKTETFFKENSLNTLNILNNNSYSCEGYSLCGTRGWLFEQGEPHDQKIVSREAGRLRMSLNDAKRFGEQEKIVFLHYPPLFGDQIIPEILDVLIEFGIKRCYYGHIHSVGCKFAFNGNYCGIEFALVSSDFLSFCPKKLNES